MENKQMVFGAIVVALLTIPLVSASGSISISTVSLPTSVTQGDTFTITLSVSGSSASSVSGTVTLPSGLSCTPTGSQTISLDASGVGTGTWSCTASVAGDYTNRITASVSATGSSGESLSDSKQAGLTVLTPASLSVSSTLSSSSVANGSSTTMTVGVTNGGDASTSVNISFSVPSGWTAPTTATGVTASGNSLVNTDFTINVPGSAGAADYTITATVSSTVQSDITTSKTITVTVSGGSGGNNNNAGGAGGGGGAAGNATTNKTSPSQNKTNDNNANPDAPGQNKTRIIVPTAGKGVVTVPLVAAGHRSLKSMGGEEALREAGLLDIILNLRKEYSNLEVSAEKLAEKPAEVPSSPKGKAYGYLKIETSAKAEDIEDAKLQFSIEKSWLSANNADATNIVLARYANGKWNALATKKLSEDAGSVSYEATTPGFSYFAITAVEGNALTSSAWRIYLLIGAAVLLLVGYMIFRKTSRAYTGYSSR